jgi:hypothetical protein
MIFEGSRVRCASILINLIIIASFTFSQAVAFGQTLAGIVHFPVKNATEGQKVLIEAKIEDPNIQVQYMRCYYRQKGLSNFESIDMQEQINNYIVEIPPPDVKMPGIEYFIMAFLKNQSMLTTPSSNPYYAPYEITVTSGSGLPTVEETARSQKSVPRKFSSTTKNGNQFETIILSPEPDDYVAADEVVIAVSFIGEIGSLNLKLIRLFIDNQNVTRQAEITPNMISYVPKNLASGIHQVKLVLKDKSGKALNNIEWQFSVHSGREKIVSHKKGSGISGNVFAEWRNENISDSTLSDQNIGANFRGKYGPIQYRGMAFFTSRDKPEFQPRNRFLLEFGTSWIGIRLGDTSPRFNELMLWGTRVRGIEGFLKLGFFNLEFAQGQINRQIEGVPFIAIPNDSTQWIHPITHDTLHSTTGILRNGTYDRTLLAIRPSFGGKFFQIGLNLVTVKDDPKSIQYSTQPKDNIVLGPDILFAIDNHRIELKASGAFSLLANDISNGAITKAEFDSAIGDIPFDPSKFEKYFVLNTSLIPLDPSKLTSLAYQTSFKFNYFNNDINLIYKSVGSEFNSLANNYLRKDMQGFSIYDRVHLYRNQVFLNLGYDKYQEGLSYEDDGDSTTAPTEFSAVNIGVSLCPKEKYLPRVAINWKSYDRADGLDTLMAPYAVNYQNKDIALQLGYDFQLLDLNHTFSISYITADRADGFARTNNDLANDIQMFSLRTVYQIPLTTVISFATNQNSAAGGISAFKYNMFGISADYNLLNRRLNLRGGFNIASAVGSITTDIDSLGNQLAQPVTSDYTDYKRTAINLGGNFQINQYHSFLLDMSFIDFNDKVIKQYSDSIIRFRYEFRY